MIHLRRETMRPICALLITALAWAGVGPQLAEAARRPAPAVTVGTSKDGHLAGEPHFDDLLLELQALLAEATGPTLANPERGFARMDDLAGLQSRLAAEHGKVQDHFARQETLVAQSDRSGAIRRRHEAAVTNFDTKYATLTAHLAQIEAAHRRATGPWRWLPGQRQPPDWEVLLAETADFLAQNTLQPRLRPFDPENLPHRSLRAGEPIPPRLTAAEWRAAFPDLAVSGKPPGLAALLPGSRYLLAAADPPTAEDLAETVEVQFTPEITQLAADLHSEPVAIYNWVRNHIEFVPTWGSIQGADHCLAVRTCNAFDTASLLIALLRVSEIPARYQMGTIEVPVDQFMNWAGGFTDPDAAASLFASAGTPSVVRRVDDNGQVVTVRLEHVWVQAWVDYAPSGGAVHIAGDTWVEIDPSFKQYAVIEGVDLEALVPSNLPALMQQLVNEATTDPTTNSLTDFDSAALQAQLRQVSEQRATYLQTQHPAATVDGAFGGYAVDGLAFDMLPATMPYAVLAAGSDFAEIPDSLRHRITLRLGRDGQTEDTADLLEFSASLPVIAGRQLVLLYTPATPADEELLAAAAAQGAPWPTAVRVVPQLLIGEEPVVSTDEVALGDRLVSQIEFSAPTISTPTILNTTLAGETTAVGLDLYRISATQIQMLDQQAQHIVAQAEQNALQQFSGLDLAWTLLSSNISAWFAAVDAYNALTSQQYNVATLRYPSAGRFFTALRAGSAFGSALSVSPESLTMDIDRDIVVSVAKDASPTRAAELSFLQGAFGSAMEAEVPLIMLSRPDYPLRGVSTMHVLSLASEQGIPIHEIDAGNAAQVLPSLQLGQSDLADIQDAINAGMEVIVPQKPVDLQQRSVVGLIVRDLVTGSASFLIGGANGGEMTPEEAQAEFELLVTALLAGAAVLTIESVLLIPYLVGIFTFPFFFSMFATLALILAGPGADADLFNLSPCELGFLLAGGLFTAVGVIVAGPLGGLLGGLVALVIGLIGIEVCG